MRANGGLWIACALYATATFITAAQGESLTGHSLVRVTPKTGDQLRHVRQLLHKFKYVDVWRHPSTVNNSVDIRVSPLIRRDVIGGLEEAGLPVTTLIADVEAIIDQQAAARQRSRSTRAFEYFHYHTLDEIYAWMKDITTISYQGLKAELFNVTESYEGRPLMGLHISSEPQKRQEDRPAFYFEGGIHAREWISPATVIYMVGKMLDEYGLDPELTATVDKFEWYILPVTNPDGYVYTWQSNQTRLWRKTRSKQAGDCIGVDPNRNWDVHWCETGASKDPCEDTYCGPSAFSEVEVKGVSDFIMGLGNVKALIDFHSFGQLWMTPYGYTKELPKDFQVQDKGSIDATTALTSVYGTVYKHGSLSNTIDYISSGSSADWTYAKADILYSYGVELRDTGEFGPLLPDDQIIPTGLETLEALKALADYVAAN